MAFKNYDSSGNVLSRSLTDLPVGTVVSTALSAAPSGWLICDGTAVSRTNYPELFGALGTGYGAGDGTTTFNVPNSDGQMILAISTAQRIGVAMPPQFVTTLPASPIDGTEVYYQADSTNGVIWHLRYRAASASAFKWEFVGGGTLATYAFTQVSATAAYSSAGTWVDIGAAISLTAPLAGEYAAEAGATTYHRIANTGNFGIGNPTTPSAQSNITSSAADTWQQQNISQRLTTTAGAVLTLKWNWGSTFDINHYRTGCSLAITPIRVSA